MKPKKGNNHLSVRFALLFLLLIVLGYFFKLVPFQLLLIYLVVSFITFLTYAIDKSKAERGNSRIPENTLHLLAFLCGWPGAAFGQQTFRHKTQKTSFRRGFWFTVIANILIVIWLLSPKRNSMLVLFG